MKRLSIIIPAYNEEARITQTLNSYTEYFDELKKQGVLEYEIVVVLNGCKDNTLGVVQEIQTTAPTIRIIDLQEQAGKGLAIKQGFLDALQRNNELIGFVDADMATLPEHFYALVKNLNGYDGIIASRYMEKSQIFPPRPWIKRFGSWLVYESLIKLLFGLWYHDFQCGAKLFTRRTLLIIAPKLSIRQWAFDVELLYLCKKFNFIVREFPTVWYDREGSKLRISTGFKMLGSLIKLRFRI